MVVMGPEVSNGPLSRRQDCDATVCYLQPFWHQPRQSSFESTALTLGVTNGKDLEAWFAGRTSAMLTLGTIMMAMKGILV